MGTITLSGKHLLNIAAVGCFARVLDGNVQNMDFDQQIAQADLISTETLFLTGETVVGGTNIRMDEMPEEELDKLPFGAIQLDTNGKVLKYNDYESRLAGVKKENAIGKNFFTEVAPCTNVRTFYGRFKEGVEKKKLHEKFRYHFSFK